MRAIPGLLAALALSLAACEEMPRDPRGTLSAARAGPLRVGREPALDAV